MLGQHDREFTAQRIMATSSPQGSEIYCPFPVLYWVRLQTRSLHGAGWVAWRLSGYRPTARRCCPGSLCEKLPPTVKDHVCPRVETHRFLSDLASTHSKPTSYSPLSYSENMYFEKARLILSCACGETDVFRNNR